MAKIQLLYSELIPAISQTINDNKWQIESTIECSLVDIGKWLVSSNESTSAETLKTQIDALNIEGVTVTISS